MCHIDRKIISAAEYPLLDYQMEQVPSGVKCFTARPNDFDPPASQALVEAMWWLAPSEAATLLKAQDPCRSSNMGGLGRCSSAPGAASSREDGQQYASFDKTVSAQWRISRALPSGSLGYTIQSDLGFYDTRVLGGSQQSGRSLSSASTDPSGRSPPQPASPKDFEDVGHDRVGVLGLPAQSQVESSDSDSGSSMSLSTTARTAAGARSQPAPCEGGSPAARPGAWKTVLTAAPGQSPEHTTDTPSDDSHAVRGGATKVPHGHCAADWHVLETAGYRWA